MEIKLKKLIEKCNKNLKGFSSKNEIIDFLPIKEDDIEIYLENKIINIKSRNEIMKIYEQDGYYSNLEILKDVAKIYGIKLKGNRILDLIKFKNLIEIKILQ